MTGHNPTGDAPGSVPPLTSMPLVVTGVHPETPPGSPACDVCATLPASPHGVPGTRDGRDILADELTDRNSAKDAEIKRLREQLTALDRDWNAERDKRLTYRAALEDAHRIFGAIALGNAGDPSVCADAAAVQIRAALEATP